MKINTLLLLSVVVASIFSTVDARYIRGLEQKKEGLFDQSGIFDHHKGGKKGKSSSSEEETTSTPTTTEKPDSTTTTKDTAEASEPATGEDSDDEIIEVEVALDLDDSLTTEDQRKVNHAIIEALNEIGVVALTGGEAPADAVMNLDRFTLDNDVEEVDARRKLGRGRYSKVLGTCRNCRRNRLRRNLKKVKSVMEQLEDKVNKILKESRGKGEKSLKKIGVEEVKYFTFEK